MSLLALLPTSTPTGIHLSMLKFSHLFAQSTKCHSYRTWPIFPEHGITSGICYAQNLNARSFNGKLNREIAKNARIQIKVRVHLWKTNLCNVGELFRNNVQVRVGCCRDRWWTNILRFAQSLHQNVKKTFFFFIFLTLFLHCICAKGVLLLDWHGAVKCCFVFS